ncbi:hypothetical protein IQ251_10805, partial [Saccharopolyspora sp. HNM0983]
HRSYTVFLTDPPGLAVQGKEWWSAPFAALVIAGIIAAIFTSQYNEWYADPVMWGFVGAGFLITLFREWRVKLVAGADWFRVNRKWVDTYALTDIELRGVWFGWMLRLRDSEGRRVRTYMPDVEANRQLWALVYNGMLHSAVNGAKVNNVAAGMLWLRPGFETMRLQANGPKIPDRVVWTLLLVVAVVFAAIYLFRPELLGPALAIFAAIVLVGLLVAGVAIAVARRKQRGL